MTKKNSSEKESLFPILVVDDDPDDRFLAETAFHDLGLKCDLRFAKDGEELMDCLSFSGGYDKISPKQLPGLILLDLNMPGKNGWESLEKIKSNPCLNNIPVIVWTTSSDSLDRKKSLKLGADNFVTKPEKYDDLLEAIRSLSEKYIPAPDRIKY